MKPVNCNLVVMLGSKPGQRVIVDKAAVAEWRERGFRPEGEESKADESGADDTPSFEERVAKATKAQLVQIAAVAGLDVELDGKVAEQRVAVLAAFKAKLEDVDAGA
jgi:hypothetical protein